nr:phosphatidate cytidylyltransferase [Salsipaludibacter albus]
MAIGIGVVLAVAFIGTTYWSPAASATLIGLFMVAASIEAAAQLRELGHRSIVPVLVLTAVVIAVTTLRAGHLGQVAGLLVLFLGSAGWLLVGPERRQALLRLGTTVILGLWISLLGSFAVLIVNLDDQGAPRLLLAIGATAFADIGAYAVGTWIGRTPVAPSLSPNKSWEGLVGGILVAGVVAALVIPQISDLPVFDVAVVAVAVALAGFVGDLFESMVKRDLGIKDFGTLLPGHGGIMDRVDGILFALPVAYAVMVVL